MAADRTPTAPSRDIEGVFRAEHGRLVATLIRRFGDIDLAEESVGDALVVALQTWPDQGMPPNPGAWLTTTAANRAIDRIRRESTRDGRHREALAMTPTQHDPIAEQAARAEEIGAIGDDRLRLIFTCCHPALAPDARVALTLRLLGGLTAAEIAQAFLVPETTMAQRLTRAKRKIKTAGIPYRIPQTADLPRRLAGVLAVLYLIFNEGYLSTSGDAPIRDDLCAEAIRLTRARRSARVADGVLVPLGEQDRTVWDRDLIAEGHRLVRECLQRNMPGQYQILAAINAVHTDSSTAAETDWPQIVALYDQLRVAHPSPIVELNRAVAVAELDGPAVGLALVEGLDLGGYHAWHVARAELLRRLDRPDEAMVAYDRAVELTENRAERAFLQRRRADLAGG